MSKHHHDHEDKEKKLPKKVDFGKIYKGPENYIANIMEKPNPLSQKDKEMLLIRREEIYVECEKIIAKKGLGYLIGLPVELISLGLSCTPLGATPAGPVLGVTGIVGGIVSVISAKSVEGTQKKGHRVYNYLIEYNDITNKLIENGYDAQEDKMEKLLKSKIKEEQGAISKKETAAE